MRAKILIVYLKEIKEILRDRRTLVFMVIMPTVLVPLLMNLLISFMIKSEKKAETEVLAFAVFGADNLPKLSEEFAKNENFRQVDVSSLDEAALSIKDNIIKFALVIPVQAQERLENSEQIAIELYYDNSSAVSRVRNRVSDIIQQVSDKFRAERLASLGINSSEKQENLISPVIIKEHGTANMREILGEHAGGFLPYMFIIFCMMGAMYPAIDLGAGEKERGTLETLLLAPIKRSQIVLGKFLVVFTAGVTSALLSLAGIGVLLAVKVKQIPAEVEIGQILSSIDLADLLLIASMLIPTAAMFAALLLSVSIYARSFKEASSYCGPLNFLAIVPAVIAVLPVVKLDWYWAMVPITNISLAIKELIKGTMNYEMFIAILGSSFIIAAGLLFFSTKWFERESVLFRQ
ncbi:MAG: ABC transporter permease [Sedimentisphaerales bacterium]|nr:ABC transporter permease [Sedimentisphaerales bacterium]